MRAGLRLWHSGRARMRSDVLRAQPHCSQYLPAQICGDRRLNVYVGISGGVDSSVAAALLKEQGHQVTGVFMRNWDTADEKGMEICPADADLASAQAVASHLDIPLVERGFEPEYWASVFEPFLSAYAEGRTPNPDIACNRHVKFGAFFDWCRAQGADAVATGHYATLLGGSETVAVAPQIDVDVQATDEFSNASQSQVQPPAWRLPKRETSGLEIAGLRGGDGRQAVLCPVTIPDSQEGGQRVLVHAVDAFKDQSYFLCGVTLQALQHVLLPLGQVPKAQVRALARTLGLPTAERRDSTGICFIGKRPMRQFLPQYLRPTPGEFVMAETGAVVGTHLGAEVFTVGQAARVSGAPKRLFTLSRDVGSGRVWVVDSWDHPALFSPSLTLAGDAALPDVAAATVNTSALRDIDDIGWRLPDGNVSTTRPKHTPLDPDTASSPLLRAAAHARICTGLASSRHWERPPFNWLVGEDWAGFKYLAAGSGVRVLAKLNNRMPPATGTLWLVNGSGSASAGDPLLQLAVELDLPHRAVSPGQIAALYVQAACTDAHSVPPLVCIGGAEIGLPGPSLAELGLESVSPSQEELSTPLESASGDTDTKQVSMPQLGVTPDAVSCGIAVPKWIIQPSTGISRGWTA